MNVYEGWGSLCFVFFFFLFFFISQHHVCIDSSVPCSTVSWLANTVLTASYYSHGANPSAPTHSSLSQFITEGSWERPEVNAFSVSSRFSAYLAQTFSACCYFGCWFEWWTRQLLFGVFWVDEVSHDTHTHTLRHTGLEQWCPTSCLWCLCRIIKQQPLSLSINIQSWRSAQDRSVSDPGRLF